MKLTLRSPPPDVESLMQRARRLAGRDLAWLAARLDRPVPPDLRRHKGWIGDRIEEALGATAGNQADCDFPHLGIELKTLPVDEQGKVRQSTFVCSAPYDGSGGRHWEGSWVQKKLARVLWVPIVGTGPIESRRIGTPLLWSPNEQEETLLSTDHEELGRLLHSGEIDQISARRGQVLQLRPKAARGQDTTWMLTDEGEWARAQPKAWYLRSRFTQEILARSFLV
ncbi:MAG: DNA mismatch repair endonuclease MutH [Myxococcota bacterium]|nr:DNA mismatch repair endonuclease MutH [Myxococcota bacterium]